MKKPYDNFVHLHAHSSIGSMQDAMTNVDAMFKKAAELGQPALALTDHGTCAAVHDARKASIKHGVKYIPGQEFYFVDNVADMTQKRRHIVLLAKNEIGYRNLLKLNYEGYVNHQYVAVMNKIFPRIDWNLIQQYNEGIICLTACGSGLISRQMFLHNEDGIWLTDACHTNVLETVKKLKNIYNDNLYLEIQPHNLKIYQHDRKTGEVVKNVNGDPIVVVDQNHINNVLIKAARLLDIKLVATADIHYLTKESAKAHDMLMAISSKAPLSDPNRHRYEVEEFYMKSSKDIIGHFNKYFNNSLAMEVVNNTIEIANKCEDPIYLDCKTVRFPIFNICEQKDYQEFLNWNSTQKTHNNLKEDHAYLRFKCVKNFNTMFTHLNKEQRKFYIQRIKRELEVIEMHNFCSYMLVVADFIEWAKKQHPQAVSRTGRGSVGGVLIGYLLGIHGVDPIKYNLMFERFHNKEKKAFPDIDTDFHPKWRDKVEEYIINKYGKEKVAHVSNLSLMTPKVVVKDIARSLELGGGKSEAFKIANQITDMIPDVNTIDEALRDSKEFTKACNKYPQLEEFGRQLVGLEKTYSTHAAGIVISDIDLSTYVPLRVDKNGTVAVQYEKNRCEENGLIKMDLLGLDHLSILSDTIDNARSIGMNCPDIVPQDFNDPKIWEEMSKGKTLCMFQLESDLMKDLCKRVKPKNIEDLAVINSLNRPSLAEWRTPYINRRNGTDKVVYKYKCLEKCFQTTLGLCIFEEQLMGLAADAAGWDLNKADGLRKLTKLKEKGKDLVVKLRDDFVTSAMSHSGLKLEEAMDIWDNYIEPFSKYGFNKSHSVAYSINGYETAWYKFYYTAPFMAAMLKSEADKNGPDRDTQLRSYKAESKRLGISVLPPNINKSDKYFSAINSKTIMTGLTAIKGVGESAVNNILEARKQHPFKNFADFLYRTDSKYVRKDVIQALAAAGCFDDFGNTRKDITELYQDVRKKINDHAKKKAILGIDSWNIINGFEYTKYTNEEYELKKILEDEKEVLGEYISGNINDVYSGFFKGDSAKLADLKTMQANKVITVEAIIADCSTGKLKNGKNVGKVFGKFQITDQNNSSASMTLWPELYLKYKDVLIPGKPVRMICKVNDWNGNKSLVLESVVSIG